MKDHKDRALPEGTGSHASHGAATASPPSVSIPSALKSEPSYADGYYAAVGGEVFDTRRGHDEAYCYGFEAGDRAVKLFEANGFTRNGASFSKRTVIHASAIEARQGGDGEAGSVHESAVPTADAQNQGDQQ